MNWEVPIKVFQAAAKSGVKKFIFASSGCAYGVWGGFCSPARFPIMESDPTPNIEDGQTLYGYYKVLFEKYMQKHAAALGMKCVALRLEGVNTNVVGPYPAYLGKFMAGHRPQEQSCKLWHFLGNCSPENYQQMLGLVIERDLDSLFEVFNVENGILHPANDPHDIIARFWPEAKDEVVGHGSLISIEKAKKLLGYNPAVPQAFSEWTENDGIQKIPSNAKLPKHPNAQQLHKTQKFSMKELVKQVLDISPLRLLRFIKRACGV
jgi:nucleoside-diphosphate-sugar epimerase